MAVAMPMSLRWFVLGMALLCQSVARAAPDSQAAIPEPATDAIGWWLFDEGEGPAGEENWAVYDQSGHGNHGLRAPLQQPNSWPRYATNSPNSASYNGSLHFESSVGCVEVVDQPSLELSGDFTIECWVAFESPVGARQLVSKGDAQSGYALAWRSDRFEFSVGAYVVQSEPCNPVPGRWYHVAAVCDSKNSTIRLRLNGELVGTRSCTAVVKTDAEPLRFGNASGEGSSATVWLDEVRISNRVVPPDEFLLHHHYGPPRVIFGDSLESYAGHGDWFSRRGGERNHWRIIEETNAVSIEPTREFAHSGRHCHLLRHDHAAAGTDHEASLYYNLPIAATKGDPIIGMRGWVCFESIDHVRLFWDQQVWTGRETHYGVQQTLLIGWVTYHGDAKHWDFDPDYQVDYAEGLGKWHYYNLIVDYQHKRLIAFQFDNDVWRLDKRQFDVLPGFFDPDLLPTIDHNIRLLETGKATAPWSAKFAQDDAALVIYRRGDFNNDRRVDVADIAIVRKNRNKRVPLGESGDVTFDGQVNQLDIDAMGELLPTVEH